MARKWFKRIGVFLAVILFLITALILFLHTSWGKSIVRNKVEKYLANKLQTTLSFGTIDYRLPNWIRLKDVLILDRKHDTLLSGGNIYVRINMLKLLSQDVDIGGIELEHIVAHIYREAGDSTFNFQFFTDAFDTGEPDVADTASKADPIRLSVHHVLLNDVRFTFNDKKEKQYFSAQVGHLYCSPRQLNPEKNLFSIDYLISKGCRVTIVDSSITTEKLPEANTADVVDPTRQQQSASLLVALEKLGLKDVYFSYKKPFEKLDLSLELDTMKVDKTSFDLAKQTATTQNIFLSNSAIIASVWSDATPPAAQKQPTRHADSSDNWNIAVDKISLIDNSVAYHNMALPPQKGFDYNHVEAKHINFFSGQNKSDENGFNADIDSCSLMVNDQFHLKGLKTSVSYANSLLLIKDLAIALNQSKLNTKGQLAWELKPGKSPALNEAFHCRIENSAISYADVLDFQPQLAKTLPVALPSSGKLTLTGNIVSTHKNLSIKDLRLHTSNNDFEFKGNANIQNSTGKDGLTYQVAIYELRVQKQLLSVEMLRKLEKENIQLPRSLTLSGKLNGTMNKAIADLKLNSEFGELTLRGEANDLTDMDRLKYDFVIDARNLETGRWIRQDSLLGLLTGKIVIKGKGYQPNKMAALCDLQLSSFVINAYTYSNIALSGELNASAFRAKGQINDPNLDVAIDIDGKLGSKYPVINGIIDINKADLRGLQLSGDSMILSSRISINADDAGSGRIVAGVCADSNTLYLNGKTVLLDSVSLTGSSAQDSAHVTLKTPFLIAVLKTNYDLSHLPGEFEHLWNRIYPGETRENIVDGNHWMSVNASLTQHELLTTFMPDLKLLQPLTISGESDISKKDSFLFFRAAGPSIGYDKLVVDRLLISAGSIDSITTFAITANKISSGKDSLLQPAITGRLINDVVTVSAGINDRYGKEYYAANVSARIAKDSTVFSLFDHLIINHDEWKVPAGNKVALVKDGLIINNFALVNRGQSISVSSADPTSLSPINISIDSIDIKQMLALLSLNDTAIAAGILHADITIQQPVRKIPVFTGMAEIRGLAYQNIPVGDLVINSATVEDSLKLSGSITGNNHLAFNGGMQPANGNISATLTLQKLDVSLIQEFVKDYISRTSGNITGDFHLAGTTKDPQFSGTIYFDSTAFAMKDFQALYKIDKQKITIDYPTIKFDHFTLTDTLNNKLSVNGTIKVNNPGEYGLNLAVETKNFVALNARRRPDSYIYGSAIIDAKMNIGGTSNEPIIEGNGYLHDKSSIHYIFTKNNDYTKAGKEGIRFVDIDTLSSAEVEMLQTSADSTVRKRPTSGLMYNLNLEISKDAEFSIIIDPSTNDELVLKGEGQLNTGIEEDGSMGITGTYRLRSGYYKMNNQFLKSTFTLSPGSTITFNGDPYNAEADVTTQYEVMTSSTGLLRTDESETPGVTKRLPYLVILKIKGPISKPELSFDIKLKKDAISIDGSLKSAIEDELERLRNDMSEINKQAFSLLVANRFTVTGQGDATASSFNPSTALANGMSQFLTEAMNEVADDLIKGVDLEVDLKNYKREDNAETQTDIGVSLSKNYMNDRLIVTIGKNFTLGEDPSTYQNNMQQYIPDITTAYKLSKDGRYRVKAYQKNEYDTVVEGYFTETGVAFTIELDYNKFKELVQRQKKSDNP